MKALLKPFLQAQHRKSSRRRSRRLLALYTGIAALNLFLVLSYLASLPSYYDYLYETCIGSAQGCPDATISVLSGEWREALGLTASGAAILHIGVDLFFFCCYAFAAALIMLLQPQDVLGSVTAFTLVSFVFGDLVFKQWTGSDILVPFTQSAGILGFMCFALWFPSGRIIRPWVGRIAVAAFLVRYVPAYLPLPAIQVDKWPLGLSLGWLIVFFGTLAYSQYTQYRGNASAEARQAVRKVAFGIIGAFAALICVNLSLVVWPQLYRSDTFALDLAIRLTLLPIPISIGSALLKDRLWGVPPIVRRSAVYAGLLFILFGVYMATVWYLALVFQARSGFYSLIATGLVAVLFSPLKVFMEKLINRTMYGKRENPVAFLVGLGDRLKEPHAPEQVLGTVVTTVKDMLQLPHASITIVVNGREQEAAAAGSPREPQAIRFPLVMGGEQLGSLYMMPRSPDEPLRKADLRLLHLLARESARIVHGLKQSLDIGRLMKELQASREKLIFAREEERRAIRNNLHDDLAPRLASLALTASAAGDYIRKDPVRAETIIGELESDIRVIVSDIREFVHNLRPPALDQYGLVEAIRQRADRLTYVQSVHGGRSGKPIRFVLLSPGELPPLPAAVEVAAYRIVSEALVNVVKHAEARTCTVTLALRTEGRTDELYVEVADDGIGISRADRSASDRRADGVGLMSVRERAAELGGRSRIAPAEGGGTRVAAWLPLQIHTDWSATE